MDIRDGSFQKDPMLPDTVKKVVGKGDLAAYDVANEFGTLRIHEHGAHITSWVPTAQQEVLWVSSRSRFAEKLPIRGGIPICFPWFGFGPNGNLTPMHGTVRTQKWTLKQAVDVGRSRTALLMELGEGDFRIRYQAIVGTELHLTTLINNLTEKPTEFELMLHIYFAVGDARAAKVQGLAGKEYIDRSGGKSFVKTQTEPDVAFGGEVDRMYGGSSADCYVVDPVLGRRIKVVKHCSDTTLVWNPGPVKASLMAANPGDFGPYEWTQMACVESGSAGRDLVKLEPFGSHIMSVTFSSEKL